eukprot:CAMPEP_0198122036 /NCGR_PEP_ID=MMETSP1442-20131203/33753_1 /TAXON_ID= /ORGANISM="Craspedostauros australis, Strain CCMP3328" /LENGTH=153 /DNA_ID=CAMNT_0043780967 /DNA_START=63 /DNA_END=524 /DNA_ORIENTATION=+
MRQAISINVMICVCVCISTILTSTVEAFHLQPAMRSVAASKMTSSSAPQLAANLQWSRNEERSIALYNADGDDKMSEAPPKSLEDKMKSWEATEEERKAATLGGVIPENRSDAFDVGLWVLFPFMIATGLIFAFFPFIMGNIDVSSVGPPPTV